MQDSLTNVNVEDTNTNNVQRLNSKGSFCSNENLERKPWPIQQTRWIGVNKNDNILITYPGNSQLNCLITTILVLSK